MANIALFKMILSKTIADKWIHFILTILEYFFLFFPSTINITKEILALFSTIELPNNITITKSHIFFNVLNRQKDSLTSLFPIIFTCLSILFIIIYTYLYFFFKSRDTTKKSNLIYNILQIIIANIFDFIFFRYFSFIFIDSMVFMIITSMQQNQIGYSALAVVLFVFIYIYICASIYYLRTYNLEYDISNQLIIYDFPSYPFNSTMTELNMYLLLIKMLIAIGNNFTFKANPYQHLAPSIDLLCFILIVTLSIKVLVTNLLINCKEAYYNTNTLLNMLRYFLIMFNLSFVLTLVLFSNKALPLETGEITFHAIGNLVISLVGLFFVYSHMKKIVFNGELNMNKILLLMIQNYSNDSNDTRHYYRIYNKILVKHFLDCNKECKLCLDKNGNANAIGNGNVNANCIDNKNKTKDNQFNLIQPYNSQQPSQLNIKVQLLFKYFKRQTQSHLLKSSNHLSQKDKVIYHYIHLLYYLIKKKVFKFFYNYSIFKKTYLEDNKLLISNIELMISCSLKEDDSKATSSKVFFNEIISKSNINKTIYNSLIPLRDYVQSDRAHYFPDKLLIISQKLSTLRFDLLSSLLKAEMKDESLNQTPFLRAMRNILEYSLIISRYIIETLFNEKYRVLAPLDVDYIEEYLTNHYLLDKALIVSVEFSNKRELPRLTILKFTGALESDSQLTFIDLFPKVIREEGEELLMRNLLDYISKEHNEKDKDMEKDKSALMICDQQAIENVNGNSHLNHYDSKYKEGIFQYIIYDNKYLSFITYSFQLSPELLNNENNMLLFGFYTIDYDKILLLNTQSKQITLLGLSKKMKSLFLLQSKWIECLMKYKISLKLSELLQSIKATSQVQAQTQGNSNSTTSPINEYHCILQYSKYSKHIIPHLESLSVIDEIKNSSDSQLITKYIEKLQLRKEIVREFKLKRLYTISPTKAVYTYISLDNNKSVNQSNPRQSEANKGQSGQYEWLKGNTGGLSTSSVQERSVLNNSMHSKSDTHAMKLKDKENCKAERKKMNKYSLLTLLLSFFICLASIIFIFIQTHNMTKIKAVSDIFNQYSIMKLSFISIFDSLISTLCYAKSPDDTTCENELAIYSKDLHDKHGLSKELFLDEFMGFEIKTKVKYFLDMYMKTKEMIYDLKDNTLIDLTMTKMNYTMLDLTITNDIQQRHDQLSFEEGIRSYYNTYVTITKYQYQNVPFYFLTMIKGNFTFEYLNRLNRTLSELEVNLYTAVMNFYNYDYSIRYGETIILNKFNLLKLLNHYYLIIFIVFVIALNIVLYFLSRANIITAYELFRDLIYNIHAKINEENFKQYFIAKIGNLLTLSLLYSTNPNDVIKTIETCTTEYKNEAKKKKKQSQRLRDKAKANEYGMNRGSDQPLITIMEDNEIVNNSNERTHKTIYNKVIIKYVHFNMYCFIVIIGFIVISDIILLLKFNAILTRFDFCVSNVLFNIWYNVIITYSHLQFILNTTETDLMSVINDNRIQGRLINDYFVKTYGYYFKMNNFHSTYPNDFPLFESFFTYDCDSIVKTSNDSFFPAANQVFNKNYTQLAVFVCEHFDLIKLRDFDQLYRDLLTRMRITFVEANGLRTYDDLVRYSRSKEIIDIYVILLLFLRPTSKYYIVTLNIPAMSSEFKDYIDLVIGFLIVDSCLEMITFAVIKWVLIRKLVRIQDDLFLLQKSFD